MAKVVVNKMEKEVTRVTSRKNPFYFLLPRMWLNGWSPNRHNGLQSDFGNENNTGWGKKINGVQVWHHGTDFFSVREI